MNWLMNLDSEIAPIIAVAALLCAICVDMRRRIGRSQRRTMDLKLTAGLLDQHRASLEEFLSSPDAPVKLKVALIQFSEVASDREAAQRVVSAICSGEQKTQGEAEAARSLFKAVEGLKATQPDLAHAFETAVASSTATIFFRWSETAGMFREYLAKAIVDSRKGTDLLARASRYSSEHASHSAVSQIHMHGRQALPV